MTRQSMEKLYRPTIGVVNTILYMYMKSHSIVQSVKFQSWQHYVWGWACSLQVIFKNINLKKRTRFQIFFPKHQSMPMRDTC